jgi:hypothetical protein
LTGRTEKVRPSLAQQLDDRCGERTIISAVHLKISGGRRSSGQRLIPTISAGFVGPEETIAPIGS